MPRKSLADALATALHDETLLTDEERADIEKSAETVVAEERKKAAADALREKALRRARQAVGLEARMVTDRLNLAEHSDKLVIDGRTFWHGHEYTLPKPMWDSMHEMQNRGWEHQDEIEGKSKFARQARNIRLNPHGIINTANLGNI